MVDSAATGNAPEPEPAHEQPPPRIARWGVWYPEKDLGASQTAQLISSKLHHARGVTATVACVNEGRSWVPYDVIVLVLPTDVTGGRAVKQDALKQELRTYRKHRPAGASAAATARDEYQVGIVHIVAINALRLLPKVQEDFAGADYWHDLHNFEPLITGSISGDAIAADTEAAIRFSAAIEGPAIVGPIDAALREDLLRRAWTEVRSRGLRSYADCVVMVEVCNDLRDTYFENPARSTFYRPLGREDGDNALDIILSGRWEDIAFSYTAIKNDLGRAVRTVVVPRLTARLPGLTMPYHKQQPLRSLYQAAAFILSQGESQQGRRRRQRNS